MQLIPDDFPAPSLGILLISGCQKRSLRWLNYLQAVMWRRLGTGEAANGNTSNPHCGVAFWRHGRSKRGAHTVVFQRICRRELKTRRLFLTLLTPKERPD